MEARYQDGDVRIRENIPDFGVDWAQLEYGLPERLTRHLESNNSSRPQSPLLVGSTLHTNGGLIGTITSLEGDTSSLTSITTSSAVVDGSYSVVKKLANDILGRLCVAHLDSADIDHDELIYALARLIQDADNGSPKFPYFR